MKHTTQAPQQKGEEGSPPLYTWYEIHEVHYDSDGKAHSWSAEGEAPFGETIDELIESMKMMGEALLKPILEYK